MPDVMGALQRARTMELEIQTQLEHIEMLHRIANRARKSSACAVETVEKLERLERDLNNTIDELCDAKREPLKYISYLSGEERSSMTVPGLLELFKQNAGKNLDNDRILLS